MRSTSKAIVALKATFQTPVYPLLDAVRCALNSKIDEELAHLKVSATWAQCCVKVCMPCSAVKLALVEAFLLSH